MTGLKFSLDDNASIKRVKDQLAASVPSIDEVLDIAASTVLNRIRTRFLAEEDPDGKKWPPSKAGLKRRAAGDTGTLFKTGTLFHSIHAVREGKDARVVTFDQTVAPYGRYHQLGTATLPRRQFIGINDEDAKIVTRVLAREIERRYK